MNTHVPKAASRVGFVSLLVVLVALSALWVSAPLSQQTGRILYVNTSDPICQGQAPCYATIQAAINGATPGDVIIIQPGTYREQLAIQGKNNFAGANESHRILIQADPAAPVGSVVLQGTVTQCTNGHAIRLQQSRFITLRGLTISGAGGQAISLLGGKNSNVAIRIERNRIFRNGGAECHGGITVAQGNPGTLIINNVIYANGRNGITFLDAFGGPHAVVQNTIHGNEWNGVQVARNHAVGLVDNLITGNGTAAGSTGGRSGVLRESSTSPQPLGILLAYNMLCGNRLGEISGPALDGTDTNNVTPTGSEGPGVMASPGCQVPSTVYATLNGTDGDFGTEDDDFTLATTSPAIDRGFDPRSHIDDTVFESLIPLIEADYTREGARPRPGSPSAQAKFDLGALEFDGSDAEPPVVTFLEPQASAHVRQTITVRVEASDNDAVASVGLSAGNTTLPTTLTPAPPASPIIATATLDTTTLADGAHTLTASATDRAGNRSADIQRAIIVDNTPPTVAVTNCPVTPIGTASFTFSWDGTDALTPPQHLAYATRLDGTPLEPPTGTSQAVTLTEGAHTFVVRVTDRAGNSREASCAFEVLVGPSITAVDPTSGPVGTLVTITGARFQPGPTQLAFNGVAAMVRMASPTSITTTVPPGATSGSLTVATPAGVASSPFTVTTSGDFTFTALPAQATAVQGGRVSYALTVAATGNFTSGVQLSVAGLPPTISPSFSPPVLGPGQTGTLSLQTAAEASTGVTSFTISTTGAVDGRAVGRQQAVAVNILAAGVTALTGRVLDTDTRPVQGVTFTLGGRSAQSDAAGNFLLLDVPAGPDQFLFIDGSTAIPDRRFPTYPVLVTLQAGALNVLPFTPHLHEQKAFNFTTIVPGQETVVTDPEIPGFAMRIPADVTIVGWDGQANTRVSVQRIPADRSPLPPPDPPLPARSMYMFYFDKVGGGTPSRPVPLTAINDLGLAPGEKAELWYYDEGPTPGSATMRWQRAGTGTVSADGRTISTDPGVGLPRFCCGAAEFAGTPPDIGPTPGGERGGDPVDLATGLFVLDKTDLMVAGRTPLTLTRTYRSNSGALGPFGVGTAQTLTEIVQAPTSDSLIYIQAGGTRIPFARMADGSYVNETIPSFRGARITVTAQGVPTLRFRDGSMRVFEREAAGVTPLTFQLTEIVDRNLNRMQILLDFPGFRPIVLMDDAQRRLQITYIEGTNLIGSIQDPIGRRVQYEYDAASRLVSVTDPAGGITSYTYDTQGNLTTITDPRGFTFLTNEYGGSGRVLRQVQADGSEWRFAYTLAGAQVTGPGCPGPKCPNVESVDTVAQGYTFLGGTVLATAVTDPRGNTTLNRFNSFGHLIERIDPLGRSTKFERAEGTNLVLSTTDPLGRVTRFTHDANGNVTTTTDAAGNQRQFTYDPIFNKVTRITDPLGNVTRFEYDERGNLTATIDPLGNRTTTAYDGFGQPVSTTDALGNTTRFEHDPSGNRTAIIGPLGNVTRREYDAASRMIRQTNPLGLTTAFAYDALTSVTRITDARGGTTDFTYDGNGNLLTVTDARGNTTGHTYDSMDRLASRTDPVGAIEAFVYDLEGNLVEHSDRKGQVSTFRYDALSRRIGAAYADGSTTSFVYDQGSRLVETTDSIGGTILNHYDTLDRLTAQTTALGTVGYQYDELGRRREMAVAGQPVTSYFWDEASRLRQIRQGGQVVALDYDDAHRRTLLTLPNGVTTEYRYDEASRLVELTYKNGPRVLGNLTYGYDAAGDRRRVGGSFARTLLPAPVFAATYDDANRQLTFGASTLTYDANGNLTGDGATTYTWDARNRLIALTGPTTASFAYDGLGRRIRKTINDVTTDFLYDGVDIQLELQGSTPVSYLRSLNVDERLARDGAEFYLAEALGSVVALTDSAGTLITSYTYEPFGRVAEVGVASLNAFRFTGREHDVTGDLYYYRARYYHTGLHRFILEDPNAFAGGDANFYAYVRNSPGMYRDPSGRIAVQIVATLAGAVIGGGAAALMGQSIVVGAVTGAATGLAASLGGPMIAGLASAAGSVANQLLNGASVSEVNLTQVAAAGILGAAAGAATGAFTKAGIPRGLAEALSAEVFIPFSIAPELLGDQLPLTPSGIPLPPPIPPDWLPFSPPMPDTIAGRK